MAARQRGIKLAQNPNALIVCSSSPGWRGAIRVAVGDALGQWPELTIRLLEFEDLAPVEQAVATYPDSVVGLEVGEENSHVVERWLREPRRERVPVVALLSMPDPPADLYSCEEHLRRIDTLATLIREAGAVWTLDSPLEARDLLKMALRRGSGAARPILDSRQLAEHIWHLLPWQSTRSPLRLTKEA